MYAVDHERYHFHYIDSWNRNRAIYAFAGITEKIDAQSLSDYELKTCLKLIQAVTFIQCRISAAPHEFKDFGYSALPEPLESPNNAFLR